AILAGIEADLAKSPKNSLQCSGILDGRADRAKPASRPSKPRKLSSDGRVAPSATDATDSTSTYEPRRQSPAATPSIKLPSHRRVSGSRVDRERTRPLRTTKKLANDKGELENRSLWKRLTGRSAAARWRMMSVIALTVGVIVLGLVFSGLGRS